MQKRGYHDFSFKDGGGGNHVSPSKTFCHTVPKNSVGEHFGVSENFGYLKILCIRERERERERGVYHVSPSKTFCHTVPKTSVVEHFGVSENFVRKKGISLNSVEKFLSHSADKIRRRTLLCFERILVSKIFKQRRGEASRFCRIFFYFTGPKKLRQGTILFQKISGREKILWIRKRGGGGVSRFPVEKFLSHCTEIFHWRTLWCFRKILLSKIFMHRRGHHGFVETFCFTGPKRKAL